MTRFFLAFLLSMWIALPVIAQGWDPGDTLSPSKPIATYDFSDTTSPKVLAIGKGIQSVKFWLNPDTTGGGATGCEVQAYVCELTATADTFSTTTCPRKILWDTSQPYDGTIDDVTIDGTSSPALRAGAGFVQVRRLGFQVTANPSTDACRITVEGY